MAPLGTRTILAAVNEDSQEEHPMNNLSRDAKVTKINEDHFTQIPEQIERRLIKKMSREINRTKTWILGALSKLDEFLLKSIAVCNQEPLQKLPGILTKEIRN